MFTYFIYLYKSCYITTIIKCKKGYLFKNSVRRFFFKLYLKLWTVDLDLRDSSKSFQSVEALYMKDFWAVDVLYRGLCSWLLWRVSRQLMSDRIMNLWHRYSGALFFMHLYVITQSRKYRIFSTGSHFNCFKTGVIWSYLRVPVNKRAAKFCTVWSLLIFLRLVADQTDEQ